MKKLLSIIVMTLATLAITMAQSGQSMDGIWLGTLSLPGQELRLAIIISDTQTPQPSGILNSIDQGGVEVPLSSVKISGDTMEVAAIQLGLRIRGVVNPQRTTWKTEFTQGTAKFPMDFAKTDRLPGQVRPQEPKPPYPYGTEEVVYRNEKAKISLAGTLCIPEGEGPFPAVVLLSGSGAQDRDENVFGHKPFLVLADYLCRQGIAVLRSDDRGVGESEGDFATSTTEDFASDALAGISFLLERLDIDPDRIGLAGHSEGGMMAPLAASRSASVKFIVLMAAPGIPMADILLFQQMQQWQKAGTSSKALELLTRWHKDVTDLAISDLRRDDLETEIRNLHEVLSEEQRKMMYRSEANLEQEITMICSPWTRYALRYKPGDLLQQLSCPVLAINGSKDMQVEAGPNLRAIEKALKTGASPDFQVKEMEGLNHIFQHAETGDVMEYGKIEETFAPEALKVIGGWILER